MAPLLGLVLSLLLVLLPQGEFFQRVTETETETESRNKIRTETILS